MLHFPTRFANLTIPDRAIGIASESNFENTFQIWIFFPDFARADFASVLRGRRCQRLEFRNTK